MAQKKSRGEILTSPVALILIVSGVVTGLGGLVAFFMSGSLLRLMCGVDTADGATLFFVRHWGILIFAVGVLITYAALAPSARAPVLAVASIEKFVIVWPVFFGPAERTAPMTGIAIIDGVFAILYVACLTWA